MLFALPLLALCGLAAAANSKRATTGEVTLFAYGGNTNGAPVFYQNDLAYIGRHPQRGGANITFTIPTDASSEPWYIAQNDTNAANTSVISGTPSFYIMPDDYSQVGFSSDAPSGAATTGFSFYGGAVAYGSDLEQAFWAVDTDTAGIWALYWGLTNPSTANSTSIVLKSTAPVLAF